jgi:uncharacterized membrane protein YqjE
MDPDPASRGAPEKISTSDSVRNWVASFFRYLELKLRLLGIESKEAGVHLLILALLFAGTVALFVAFLLLFSVFLLYLVMKLFGIEWGWSALICGGTVLLLSVVSAVVLRFQITKPIFKHTRAELQKDRAWLARTKTNSD